MFLPGHETAVQVNQSAAGFPQLLASAPESCLQALTPRIETEAIPRSRAKRRNAHQAEGRRWPTTLESLYQYYIIVVLDGPLQGRMFKAPIMYEYVRDRFAVPLHRRA
jgi:hypothetical protein